jgi:hypothetical protein
MGQTTGWVPDPYGVHEFRFFSTDGKPTLLVMDGGKRSYDKPPTTDPPPVSQPSHSSKSESDPQASSRSKVSSSPAGGTHPGLESAQALADADQGADQIKMPTSEVETDQSADPDSALAPDRAHGEVSPVTRFADERPGVVGRSPEPMSRPLKIAYGVVFGVLVLSLLGLAYVHLRHSGSSPSRSAQRATTTSLVRRTTTTVVLPTAPKPGAEAAASALISSWSTQNRAAALTVATQAAVNTLFAVPYANGLAEDRGCSTSFTPIVCTFGPPGGASPNDPIYQLYVSQALGGWYVSSVKLENVGSGRTSPSS